jgi:26S proteasome regulatory subunit T2
MERVKDYLTLEEEFMMLQERDKPQDERGMAERKKVDELRGTPMMVGALEEMIDDDHAIVSTPMGPEHYVAIMSFVDKDLLEPNCSVLLHHKVKLASQSTPCMIA